jgi:hypothetical protein
MKKCYYRFFTHHVQHSSHEETVLQSNVTTPLSKRYNHRRDGIETEVEAESPRITRYEKDRLKLGNKKIVAVGYVGMCGSAIDVVNKILGKKIFNNQIVISEKWDLESFPIDSYHDTENGTIYLYLSTALHLTNVLNVYSKTNSKGEDDLFKGELAYQLDDREYQMTKALLFMFHTCHIINFITADRRFDLKLPRLLRTLQLTKQTMNQSILNHLSTHPLTHSLKFNSLYSVGRVLPVFNIIWVGIRNNIEKVSANLEIQVRAILKRAKLSGTDNTRTPLVMIDPTRCVFILDLEEQPEPMGLLGLENITRDKTSPESTQLVKFKEHIARQFDYFSRQMQTGKRYVLPSSFNWYHACFALESFDWNDEKIRSFINPDWQFSENRCAQAFQLVKDQFAQIQDQYTTTAALTTAATLTFDAYACGPYQEIYRKKTADEFKNVKLVTTSEQPSMKLIGDRYPVFPVTSNMPIIEFYIHSTKDDPESLSREGICLPNVEIMVDEVINDDVGVAKLLRAMASYDEGTVKKTVKKKIYIGYEYDTNQKKFFLTNDILAAYLKYKKNDKKKNEKANLIISDIPLQIPSHFFTKEKSSTTLAQMICIYVYTPNIDTTVVFAPRIEDEEEENTYGGINVILARAHMTTITLVLGEKKGKFSSCITISNGVVNIK